MHSPSRMYGLGLSLSLSEAEETYWLAVVPTAHGALPQGRHGESGLWTHATTPQLTIAHDYSSMLN